MNYRKITESVRKLRPIEAYIFIGLSYFDIKGYLHPNEETIASLLNVDRKTVCRAIKTFKDNGLITISKQYYGCIESNSYIINKDNYRLVDMQIINEEISRELKGFLIKLWCCTFNNDAYTEYTNTELAKLMGFKGTSSVEKYLSEAKKIDYIDIKKKGKKRLIIFKRTDIFIPTRKSDFERIKLLYPEILTDDDYLTKKIN